MDGNNKYFVLILLHLSLASTHTLRGHLQPLGFQRDTDGDITTLSILPSNEEFYQLLINKETALLKNAAKRSPAIDHWTEKYLKEKYGNLTLKLEGKSEDQTRPEGNLGLGFDTISNFIDSYHIQPKYAVTQLPDPMRHEIFVMPFMRCGPLSTSVIESHLWMSSGQTSSRLHRDNTYTLHCSIKGRKDWILMDSKHLDKMYINNQVDNFSGSSSINPDRVNLLRYPRIAEIPFKQGNITPGDCILVPPGCAHQVRSHGPVNVAFTFLFEITDDKLKNFNPIHCSQDYVPLSQYHLSWSYSGSGILSMGNSESNTFRKEILEQWFGKRTKIHFNIIQDTFEGLLKYYPKEATKVTTLVKDIVSSCQFASVQVAEEAVVETSGLFDKIKFKNGYRAVGGSGAFADKILTALDSNQDGLITISEVASNLDVALESYKLVEYDDDVNVPSDGEGGNQEDDEDRGGASEEEDEGIDSEEDPDVENKQMTSSSEYHNKKKHDEL
ncbi:uncharacterized protein TRIADDRAFT_57502 [Trichoplax adhaerens]|uniref:JmjC domain-containing protein n=1 Tax=Trichoplax adhaerens TaxID=10228 RepID=B3RZL7_TRIAD|nr:hypothetical protein TRIADDRAFT_57502 [Trichoplax adhaerens]EDV23858.1 hypothetical protein TRIADDRAFT_57502 [Trichoplax adhaerens]|eukprot:XP_002113384.1 hypothetical protein TRIADDRAFT_57502 [Trichoplax adhaerens]